MRISRLYMPAVTLAGALALAGCGGSDNNNQVTRDDDDGDKVVTQPRTQCLDGTTVTAPATCPPAPSESAFAKAGGTPVALLDKDGLLVRAAAASGELPKAADRIDGLHGSENPGMKWHEALNAPKVSLTIGTTTGEGYAIKVTGKKLADLQAGGTTVDLTGPSDAADTSIPKTDKGGVTNADVAYMGVEGRLVCNADNCKAPTGSGGLIGDWYFVADDADAEWVKDGEEYADRSTKPHADWGVWLADADSGAGKQIRWVRSAGPGASLALVVVPGLPKTATYKGGAVGVSTKYRSGNVAATVGSFKADAELTAKFGTADDGDGEIQLGEATLKGMIKGFEGDAVNPGWELTLEETLLPAAGAVTGPTKAGSATTVLPNSWSAQLYGEADKRPAGVVGDFNGRFGDGQAVGVFHAK